MLTVTFAPSLSWFNRLLRDDGGQDLIEYAMLAGLIAVVTVGAVTSLGTSVNTVLWEPFTTASF